MADPIDTTGIMLGELKGQMREVVHTLNNMSMKLDGLSREGHQRTGVAQQGR
jgi:hypothetical protein